MDDVSATLIRLLAWSLPEAYAPGLTLAPARAMLRGVLGAALPAAELEPIVAALGDVAEGRRDLVAGLEPAAAALERALAGPAARAALAERMRATQRALDLATTLGSALAGSLAGAEILLDAPELFGLARVIALPGGAGRPELHIVGAALPTGERLSLRFGRSPLLDRVEITYEADSPFPLLNLSTASRGEEVDWAASRSAWRQEPDLDLIVQNTTGSRDLGTITTARVTPPWAYQGERLRVSIPPLAGHELVITQIADPAGAPLAHAVRVCRALP